MVPTPKIGNNTFLVTGITAYLKSGDTLVERTGFTLERTRDAIARVVSFVQEIEAAALEQNSGIDQVDIAVTQTDSATQQNAALVEEGTAAAHALEKQAVRL